MNPAPPARGTSAKLPPGEDERLTAQEAALRLERGAARIRELCEGASPDDWRARPSPERWSMLEVVNHLADEEVFDFRARVESTLRDPGAAWPGIAPADWVRERDYQGRDPSESLRRFLGERTRSLAWLRALERPAWDNVYVHPKAGPLSARLLLANWIAHDLLHARQLLRLEWDLLRARVAPLSLDYAGPWS